MKSLVIICFITLIHISAFTQNSEMINNIEFNGYIQVRGISNFNKYTNLSIRRLKLWIKSKHGFSKHWSYKIQTTFTSFHNEKFFLQDVKIGYDIGRFSFDIGQFVPQYSLQRFQHDYKLPSIERARAINILIPDGTLGVRDIGLQANFCSKNNFFQTHIGIFNGYGIRDYHFNNKGYMIVQKSEINFSFAMKTVKIGYSLQYRYANNLLLPLIFPDTIKYSGNDFRYNLFTMFKSKYFELQGEYLSADFNGQKTFGYYFLSAFNYRKNQWVLSFENYKGLFASLAYNPYYRIGYNYLINSYKIKLSLDNCFQIDKSKIINDYISIQLQLFLK